MRELLDMKCAGRMKCGNGRISKKTEKDRLCLPLRTQNHSCSNSLL